MRSKLSLYGFTLLTSLAVVACSKVPDGILKEKDMQSVMVDMYLAEAMIGADYATYQGDEKKDAMYQSVFRKHNISQAEYDSSIIWYGKNLKIYMEVYDGVLAEIESRTKALGDVQANAGPASARDSLNIWPRRNFAFLEGNKGSLITYNVKPDVAYASGSTFVFSMNVWGVKANMKHTPEVRLSLVQNDTTINITRKLTHDGYYQVLLRSVPVKQVQQVYGYIRMLNADSTCYKVYIDSISLMKYNYGTVVTIAEDSIPGKSLKGNSLKMDSVKTDSMIKKQPLTVKSDAIKN